MRLLGSLLYSVGPIDPIVYGVAAALLTATAVVAASVPAWRATGVDPVTALRAE